MGTRHYIKVKCAYCGKMNPREKNTPLWQDDVIFYAPSSGIDTFECDFCGKKNKIIMTFKAEKDKVEELEEGFKEVHNEMGKRLDEIEKEENDNDMYFEITELFDEFRLDFGLTKKELKEFLKQLDYFDILEEKQNDLGRKRWKDGESCLEEDKIELLDIPAHSINDEEWIDRDMVKITDKINKIIRKLNSRQL